LEGIKERELCKSAMAMVALVATTVSCYWLATIHWKQLWACSFQPFQLWTKDFSHWHLIKS